MYYSQERDVNPACAISIRPVWGDEGCIAVTAERWLGCWGWRKGAGRQQRQIGSRRGAPAKTSAAVKVRVR